MSSDSPYLSSPYLSVGSPYLQSDDLESSAEIFGLAESWDSDVEEYAEEQNFALNAHQALEGYDDPYEGGDRLVRALLSLKGQYLLEKEDPRHRMGDMLNAARWLYEQMRELDPHSKSTDQVGGEPVWKSEQQGRQERRERYGVELRSDPKLTSIRHAAHKKPLYEWLDSIPEFERISLLSEYQGVWFRRGKQVNLSPKLVNAFLKGVKYLDAAARRSYELEVKGGQLWQGGEPFSTDELQTEFSGVGVAIWVASPDGRYFAGNHVRGEFHHSSFLAGGSVTCAGEMAVHQGQIKMLNAKTGHYRTQRAEFANALKNLQGKGIRPESYKVYAYDGEDNLVRPAPTGKDFLDGDFKAFSQSAFREHLDPEAWR